jgi:hypothetical protein
MIKTKLTKITKCIKCHLEFVTEVDKMGVPYNKICSNCKKNNKLIRNYKVFLKN